MLDSVCFKVSILAAGQLVWFRHDFVVSGWAPWSRTASGAPLAIALPVVLEGSVD